MRKSREGLERKPCSKEQWREVDLVSAREKRWNNTEQCCEAERTRRNTRKIDSKYIQNFPSIKIPVLHAPSIPWNSAAVQGKSHDSSEREIKTCLEKVQNGKHRGKMVDLFIYREPEISSIQSIFCWKFCLEDSHSSKFPYCGKQLCYINLPLRFP